MPKQNKDTPSALIKLPELMVAPNGARLTTNDHSALPVTIPQIIETTIECKRNGADGLHAHVRDKNQKHILDAGLYKELLAEFELKLPDFYVQITTEAVGLYSPQEQRQLIRDVVPKAVSISITEMMADDNETAARNLYYWANDASIQIQHILYSTKDVARFIALTHKKIIPEQTHHLLFVLGRYSTNKQSLPTDLDPFLAATKPVEQKIDWAVCAFGNRETDCLKYVREKGGKVRIGFENNLHNSDGSIAANNAARITDLLNT